MQSLGPLKFNSEEKDAFIQTIIKKYPTFIAEVFIDLLDETKQFSWLEKIKKIIDLQYNINRLATLVCFSFYLNDKTITEGSDIIKKHISELLMPTDTSWKNILIDLVKEYDKLEEDGYSFPVQNLSNRIKKLDDLNAGYQYVIADKNLSIITEKSMSVYTAGIQFRNAFHHDTNTSLLDNEDYRKLFIFIQDIVLSLLDGYNFLTGDFYELIAYEKDSLVYESLHGIKSAAQIFNIKSPEDGIYLFDKRVSEIYPLYPLMLKLPEFWGNSKELYFSEFIRSTKTLFEARYVKRYEDKEDIHKKIQNLLEIKKLPLRINLEKFNFKLIVSFSIETTAQTLEGYVKSRYFPEAYIEKSAVAFTIDNFIRSDKTALFFNGPAGIGKSALLAHIASKYMPQKDEQNTYDKILHVPIFINAKDTIVKEQNIQSPVLNFIRQSFLIKDSAESDTFQQFIDKINSELNREFGENNKPIFLLIIDAVNEAADHHNTLLEIHNNIIQKCVDRKGKNKCPWLKIIFSTRNYIHIETDMFRNETQPDYNAYYPDQKKLSNNQKDYYVTDLEPLTEEEMMQAFKRYAGLKKFSYLINNPPNIATLHNKKTILTNPLMLSLYVNLLDLKRVQEIKVGTDPGSIIAMYYDDYTRYNGAEEILFCIVNLMINEYKKPMIPLDSGLLMEREKILKINWGLDGMGRTEIDPLRKMIDEGLLQKTTKKNLPEGEYESYISFTYQRFAEEVIYRYLTENYPKPSKNDIISLFEKEAAFEEYNNALVMFMKPYWDWQDQKFDNLIGITF